MGSFIINLHHIMMEDYLVNSQAASPAWLLILPTVLFVIVVWSAIWKGIALWRAGRNNHLAWFVCLLLLNTLGILEIIYIFGFSKKGPAYINTVASSGIKQ